MTSLSVFLAEFLGLFVFIISAAYVSDPDSFERYARKFAEDISIRYTVAILQLALGLAVVLTHNIWEMSYVGIITALGWMMLIESVFHLVASEGQEELLVNKVLDMGYPRLIGAGSMILGVYLFTHGFAFI